MSNTALRCVTRPATGITLAGGSLHQSENLAQGASTSGGTTSRSDTTPAQGVDSHSQHDSINNHLEKPDSMTHRLLQHRASSHMGIPVLASLVPVTWHHTTWWWIRNHHFLCSHFFEVHLFAVHPRKVFKQRLVFDNLNALPQTCQRDTMAELRGNLRRGPPMLLNPIFRFANPLGFSGLATACFTLAQNSARLARRTERANLPHFVFEPS